MLSLGAILFTVLITSIFVVWLVWRVRLALRTEGDVLVSVPLLGAAADALEAGQGVVVGGAYGTAAADGVSDAWTLVLRPPSL